MTLPALLENRLSVPVIAAPLFIISQPELVLAQCRAGVVGSFPSLNARPSGVLEQWLQRLTSELTDKDAPFAVNLIVHRTNDPARGGRGTVRQVQGADHHHLARRAARHQRGDPQLWRDRVPRHHRQQVRARKAIEKGADGLDRGRGGRRRPCRHAVARSRWCRRSANGSTGRSRCRARSPTAMRSPRRARWARTSAISDRPSSPPRRRGSRPPTSR